MKMLFFSGRTTTKLLVAALGLQIASVATLAQNSHAPDRVNASSSRDTRSTQWMSDNDFLAQAYGKGLVEIKLAHAAVDTSRDPDVQKMGHRIINEQQRANEDLKRVAESKKVTLPTELSQRDQQTYDRLSKLQGAEFDRAYRDHLNTDYKHTIQMFETAAQRAQDSQVRSVASQYATLFEQHAQVIGISGLGSASSDTYSGRDDRGYVREREGAATSSGSLAASDQNFLTAIHRTSRTEVEAARLALKNSSDQKVKTLAQSILNDNQRMERDLSDLAAKRGLKLTGSSAIQQQAIDNLSNATGNQFDTIYHSYLMDSHRNTMKMFQTAESSSDPDVQNFARQYAPVIREHFQAVQRTGEGGAK